MELCLQNARRYQCLLLALRARWNPGANTGTGHAINAPHSRLHVNTQQAYGLPCMQATDATTYDVSTDEDDPEVSIEQYDVLEHSTTHLSSAVYRDEFGIVGTQ